MKKNLTKQTISGFFWLSVLKIVNAVMHLGILAILARILSPTEFGLMSVVHIIVAFSNIFTDMGFGPAITQKRQLVKIDIQTSFCSSVILGVFLMLILWFCSPFIASFFQKEELISILKAISLVLLLHSVSSTPLGLMYRNMLYKKASFIQIFSFITYGIISITMAYLGFGVWALVYGEIGKALLFTLFCIVIANQPLKLKWNKESFKELLHFGGGHSLGQIFNFIGLKGEKFVIGRILGIEALGFYERGYQIVKYISGLMGEIIDKALFSPMAKKQDNRELIGKIFIEITYVISIIMFPLSCFFFCNADCIVKILLGDQWEKAVILVKIMSLCFFFLVSVRVSATLANSLGDVYKRALRHFIYAVCVITGVFFGVKWGTTGAATAATIAIFINYLLAFTQTSILTKVSFGSFFEAHFLGIILSLIFWGISNLISIHMSTSSNYFILFLLNGVVLFLIYVLSYFIDYKGVVRKYIKHILEMKKK